METNLLQQELDRIRSSYAVNDLSDTNFHRNGYRFPSGPIATAMEDYLRVREYNPDPLGLPDAREAVRRYYGKNGISLLSQNILLTASSSESYNLLFNNLAEPGDNIILPRPTYPLFEYLAAFNHLEVRYYDMDPDLQYAIRVSSVETQIDARTRFIVLISPNNPTGRTVAAAEIEELLRLTGRGQAMLIVDEVFSEFLYDGHTLDRPAAIAETLGYEGPIFTLNGISKMFASPDLKLGWIAVTGDPGVVAPAVERLEIANDMFLNCNGFSQFLLPRLFETGDSFTREMVATLDRSRRMLVERVGAIRGARLVEPNSGIHAIVAFEGITDGDDEQFAVELLRQEHVYVHPGYLYGMDSGIRVVVSFLRQYEELSAGLDAIARFVDAKGGRS